MNEIEKIQRYIKLTGSTYKNGSPYNLALREMRALRNMGDFYGALGLAFEYGRAKGERSAKAAQKRKTAT